MQIPECEVSISDPAALTTFVHQKTCAMLMRQGNNIIKIFYRKRLCSIRTLLPAGKCFVRNSRALAKRDVATLSPQTYLRCKHGCCEIVIYPNLIGDTLRDTVTAENPQLLFKFAQYLADLHRRGIFFRGIHLGNVLYNDGKFYLIDIADLKCTFYSLLPWQRARNLRHLLNYHEDATLFNETNKKIFLETYAATAAALNNLPRSLNYWLQIYGIGPVHTHAKI